VKAIRRHPISGPFIVLMNSSPDLATRFAHLGHYFHARGQADESILPIRVRTFMAAIGARTLNAAYEWSAWITWAIDAGVPQETVDAIRERRPLNALSAEDALVLDFCSQLVSGNHRVSDAVFDKARAHFGVQQLVELVGTLGYFAMIAYPLNAFEMEMTEAQKKKRKPFEPLPVRPTPFVEQPRSLPAPATPIRAEPRVPLITAIENLPAASHHFYDRIVRTRGHIAPPYQVLLNSPDMAERICHVGDFFNFCARLAPDLNALTWLMTARAFDAHYAWENAKVLADRAQLPRSTVDAIERGASPDVSEEQRLTCEFCRQLLYGIHHVDDAAYRAAVERLGVKSAVQIAATVGYVAMMSIITNAFEVAAPEDKSELVL
jgi:4-carboxymuconolactone decarboxylase